MGQSDADRERLRRTFAAAAERYDRIRPSYPAAILDRLADLTGLGPGDRVLEIGCGTGQLTRSLVGRGYAVTAIELSAELADRAQRNLPDAEVIQGDFESWPLPDEPFAAVVAATSFHWIDPAVRFAKTAAALRPDACSGSSPPVTSRVAAATSSSRCSAATSGGGRAPPGPASG